MIMKSLTGLKDGEAVVIPQLLLPINLNNSTKLRSRKNITKRKPY